MSESSPALPPQRYTLNARPPLRPLAIGAVTAVVGAALLVFWQALTLPVAVAVLGGLLLVLGLALALAALLLTARLRTAVTLFPHAISVVRGGKERSVPWREITEVSLTHPRLTLMTDDRTGGVVVVNPRHVSDPVFSDLVDQVRRRLDADRGYTDEPLSHD